MKPHEIKTLLSQMDLEEKINQLLQIPGIYYKKDATVTGEIQKQIYSEKQIKEAGSVLGIYGAKQVKEIQKQYIKYQPHHIPLMFMLDVIHGFRTIFPIPLAQGATFNPDLVKDCSSVAAEESAVSGVHVSFAPMADLSRDARWGRVMESYGEDPYLNGVMTAATVGGFQGIHVGEENKIAACVKHFAGYGAPTAGREYNDVDISEHTFRENHIPAYQKGIEAGTELVMTSFNTLNGVPASGNQWLMRDILRKQMGFDGVLISDWGAIKEMIPHGFCANQKEAAQKALCAGVDIDMATDTYCNYLKTLVEEGKINEELLDEAVYRVLSLKNKLGLFENPYKNADEQKERERILCEEHRNAARQAARESFVLLKNDGDMGETVLPLNTTQTIALIGPYVNYKDMHSAWAITGEGGDAVTVMEAAKSMLEYNFIYAPIEPVLNDYYGLSRGDGSDTAEEEAKLQNLDKKAEQMESALHAAAVADTVVIFLGEHRLQSGEAASRTDIRIPQNQMELFREVCSRNHNVVTVVFSGRPLELREISQKSQAILLAWMPGTEGGPALMEVLSGKFSPSGKLPMSFPYTVGQLPIFYSQYATGRPMKGTRDNAFYCSRYIDCPNEPLYPFGYGLGYTDFEISKPELSSIQMKKNETIRASVWIYNNGKRKGSEVIQLYIRDLVASVVRPVKEMKGFKKVELRQGESVEVLFDITEDMLRFHNEKFEYISEIGKFLVWIGNSSVSGQAVEVELV